jgi:hypothetical protein
MIRESEAIWPRRTPAEMERLREHAERNYAGNLSTLVKVAVRRLIESANDPEKKAA